MEALFIKLLNISITASWVVLAVIVFRLVLKKAPKFITVLMWALVAIRLVLPVSVESAFSLIPNTAPVSVVYGEDGSAAEESEPLDSTVSESISDEEPSAETEESIYSPPVSESEESADALPSTSQAPSESVSDSLVQSAEMPDESLQHSESTESEDESDIGGTVGGTVDGDGTPTPPTDTAEPNDSGKKKEDGKGFLESALPLISAVWAAGVLLMLIYAVISYIRVRRSVREAVPLKGGVWVCDGAPTPFILGLVKPRIYLPSSVAEEDKKYVIAHERAHIRRGDHLWKPLGFLLLTVYWFNPLMWLAYVLLCRDIEYATDEKALGSLGLECKKPYSMALINCSAPKRLITACPLAFGEMNVKSRIKSVLSYKKPTLWVIIAAAVACLAILLGFMTNPKTEDGADSSSKEENSISIDGSETDIPHSDSFENDDKEISDGTEHNKAENDKSLTAAIVGTWYGVGEDDIGKEFVLRSGGSGQYGYNNYATALSWVIKDGRLTFMYNNGGEFTVSHVRCENGVFSFIDETGEHSFSQTITEEADDIKWSVDENGTLTVSGHGELYQRWSPTDGEIKEIKSVIIDEGITSLGVSVFRGCTKLESVQLPESLVKIGASAFAECTSLSGINIPDGVLEIDSSVFSDTALYNDESNWKNGGLYIDNCLIATRETENFKVEEGTVLIASGAVKNVYVDKLVLPEGLKRINYYAFATVGDIHIPASVEQIHPQAFFDMRSFTVDEGNSHFSAVDGHLCNKDGTLLYVYADKNAVEVRIPDGVKYTCSEAAAGVTAYCQLYLPESLELFNVESFKHMNVENVWIDGDNSRYVSKDGVVYSEDGKTLVFYPYRKKDEHYTVEKGTEYIGDSSFYSNDSLKSLTLPDGVTVLGTDAFWGCEALAEITLPEGLKVIKDWAFCGCYGLKTLILPDSVSTIGNGAFHGAGLTDLKLGKGILTIGDLAFYGTYIRELYIGTGVMSIGNRALSSFSLEKIELAAENRYFTLKDGVLFDEECKTLVRYVSTEGNAVYNVPVGVERIESYAFENCHSLKIVGFKDGTEDIGKGAFENCSALMYIVIPESVRDIRYDQFLGCSSLDTVYFGGSEDRWAELNANAGNNDLTRAEKVFGVSIDDVENAFKELKVFATSEYYYDYSVTKDVYYDGTAEGMMKALIKHGKLPAGSKINSLEIRDGVAYLDVNRAFTDGISTGTTMQYEGIGALVNTVVYNLDADTVMLSCEGGTLSLPDVGELDEPVGFFSGWLVYGMVEGERRANALLPTEEEKAMKLMCAFLKALSEGNTEVCEKLMPYGDYEDGYDFIMRFNIGTADTLTLPEVQKFSYYFNQSVLEKGHVAFSTGASDGDAYFEVVFVLSYDDVFGVKLYIVDAGYENIH